MSQFNCIVGLIVALLAMPGPDDVSVKGLYNNPGYGYTVTIPRGLVGKNLVPPAPQHGFGIDLGTENSSYIWVDGSYDALLIHNLAGLAADEAIDLSREYGLRVASTADAKLGKLEARQVVLLSAQNPKSGDRVEFDLAYRTVSGEVGIVYVVGLRERGRDAKAEAAFLAVVKSFVARNLP